MIAVIADLLALFVVPSFLVGLAAVVLWCARRDFRRDARHPRRGGGGRHRRLLGVAR